ncbi:hypothetical protein SOVF_174670 isoform B [Spinacia oleracea]|nr:hypothetical protein SOVF_174670 isoform B [Spinacia oleracea]
MSLKLSNLGGVLVGQMGNVQLHCLAILDNMSLHFLCVEARYVGDYLALPMHQDIKHFLLSSVSYLKQKSR